MKTPSSMPRLKGFRFPREIIAYAVWAYHGIAKLGDCGRKGGRSVSAYAFISSA